MAANLRIEDTDNMDGRAFEYFCADILRRNGYTNVQVTQGSGDYGVDILAEKDSVTYAIQCKCYSGKVGNKAVQEVFSGAAYYGRNIAVVMTNSYFTQQAIEMANRTSVILWNRTDLSRMIGSAGPGSSSVGCGSVLLGLILIIALFAGLLRSCSDSIFNSAPSDSETNSIVETDHSFIGPTDYADAKSVEAALNNGENLKGATVRFVVDELRPNSIYGYNIWAGEHLNFVSDENPNVQVGDVIVVKITAIKSWLGSWIISYERIG